MIVLKKIFIVIIFLVGLIIIDGFFINPKGFKIVEKNYIEQKYLFNTISIDTSNYKFNREEANER